MTIFLSYILDKDSPSYGNIDRFDCFKKSAIANGDTANNTHIQSSTHIGTHLDMPYHFFDHGQSIDDFDASFWIFYAPLILEVTATSYVIRDELIEQFSAISDADFDIIIIKTGQCNQRNHGDYGTKNIGFSPDIADIIRKKFPLVRIFGFDSISVSSYQERVIGREAHRAFLDPKAPILLLEDMDLRMIHAQSTFKQLIVSPLRIKHCDGIPCTVFAR